MRGAIRNREASNAVKDYTRLRWKSITPTDIDGLIDFKNKLFVIIELKRVGEKLEGGQRLALERLADSITQARKPCYLIVAQYDTDGDIQADTCLVSEMRHNKRWRQSKENVTLKCLIDRILSVHAPEYLENGQV